MALNERQKQFCREYVKCGNATQSAIKAGYTENGARQVGQRLLTNVYIQEYIAELNAKARKNEPSAIADAQEILEFFSRVMRGEEVSEKQSINPVSGQVIKMDEKPTTDQKTKAAIELAKRYGLNTPKIEIDVKPVVITYDLGDDG